MRKLLVLAVGVMALMSVTGCGSSSSSSNTTNYVVQPAADIAPAPVGAVLLGGAIQGTALPLASQVVETIYSGKPLAGGVAGFSNVTSAGGAIFNRPLALTTDGTSLYVADYLNNAIRKINIATRHVTVIAGSTLGLAGSVDGVSTVALFNRPSGITTDGTFLYVTDSLNYVVRKIDGAGNVVTLAGTAGQAGHVDATGPSARFNVLNGITINGNYLYVTDSDNTIRMIHKNTGVVTTLAGSPGNSGSTDGLQGDVRFNMPMRLTTDGPNLYITDFGNSTIRKIVLATGRVSTIAGVASPGGQFGGVHQDASDGSGARFNQPNSVTCDGFNLYVTDSYDNMLRKIVLTATGYSGPVSTLGPAFGAAATKSIAGITTDGTFLYLTDVSVDNSSHVIRQLK